MAENYFPAIFYCEKTADGYIISVSNSKLKIINYKE